MTTDLFIKRLDPPEGPPTVDDEPADDRPTLPNMRVWRLCECGRAFQTSCGRTHCAPCFLAAAAQARERILETPEIKHARQHLLETLAQRVPNIPF